MCAPARLSRGDRPDLGRGLIDRLEHSEHGRRIAELIDRSFLHPGRVAQRVAAGPPGPRGEGLQRAMAAINASPYKDRVRIMTGVNLNNVGPGWADKAIEQLEADLAKRAAHIERLETDVADRTSRIERLEVLVSERSEAIERLDAELAERADLIQGLEADLGERGANI